MSFNYDRYDRRQPAARARSTFGYWVPLVLTVTVATAGLAAWVWSERRDDEDESSDDDDLSYGEGADRKHALDRSARSAPGAHNTPAAHSALAAPDDLMARVQGVIRRTPSPQQVFDTVSKKTAAGWAAAGAALASIREEDKDDYGDHSRWSEEAAAASLRPAPAPAADSQTRPAPAAGKRKTVVLVVSAESLMDAHDAHDAYRSENASLLSHLPDTDVARTRLFVLVYSPALRSRPASPLGSSYSAIDTPARTPGEELASIDPQPDHSDPRVYTPALSARSSDTLLWNTLHAQALRLVEHPALVMPFATPTGFVHMLRHLAPDLVYLVDALSGPAGRNVDDIKRWVGQTVVVVGADGTGLGGLVDTDDEAHGPAGRPTASEHRDRSWWESADMVGLGKGVEVVDASRFEDDYDRRVRGRD